MKAQLSDYQSRSITTRVWFAGSPDGPEWANGEGWFYQIPDPLNRCWGPYRTEQEARDAACARLEG